MVATEWIGPDEACEILSVGVVKLAGWVDDGTLVAEGVNGAFLFRRSDVERLAAHRPEPPRKPAVDLRQRDDEVPYAAPGIEPASPTDEELEQARLIGQFIEAALNGLPGPCPVCGMMMRQRTWPAHLRQHR